MTHQPRVTEAGVQLSTGDQALEFVPVELSVTGRITTDVFAHKNNKTLRETLLHGRYSSLEPEILVAHSSSLDADLGVFLAGLKAAGNPLYKRFLNQHGDSTYCGFALRDPVIKRLKGLYCFTVGEELKYIGRCTDSFGKRINQGYGRIHPKNCYRDGQSTNCHLNSLIAGAAKGVRLHVHPMLDNGKIESTEAALITAYNPEWNVQLRDPSAP